MIITREKGMRMWGGGSGSTSASGVNGGGGFSLAVTEGEGTGNAYTDFTYESGILTLNKGTEFVTVDFFNKLFTAYDANGNVIAPNNTTPTLDNIKFMAGAWTEQYLSALGQNSSGGGGGGGIELSDVWQSLKTNTDDYANQKINAAHIPDLSGTYATRTWVNQQGFVTSSGVTSVAMTVPTGLSVSGSPITSTGTLALTFATGYSIPTTAKQSNWDTAYGWGNHATAGYAMSATNIIAGNGLTGGGTLAADRTLSIQLQTNSGLAVSSSGLKLDIINNLTTESAYKAISATQAKKIWDLLNQMFTLEGAGTTASPYVIKANYGLYTEQFLSALGQNSSGGGSGDFDEAQMWAALQANTGTYANTKINANHIPDISSTYGYAKTSQLGSYLPLSGGTLTGTLTAPKIRINTRHNSGNTSGGIYYYDGTTDYLLIGQGSANLWIGANETSGTHHAGSTYISAGTGNVNISRLVNGSRLNYMVLDTGNYSSYALPLTGGALTGSLTVNNYSVTALNYNIKFDVDTSREMGYNWLNTSGTRVASVTYHNTAQNIILNPVGSSETWSDAVGKYSLIVGNNSLTYNTYPILHSNNYSSYALPLSGGTLTGNVTFNGVNKGIYLTDSGGNTFAGIIQNGTNLWIGAQQTTATHHTGGTYISAGDNRNLFVSKLVNDTRTNYIILDTDNTYTSSGKGYIFGTEITTISGNAATATTASKLSTTSKTAWGQTYWTSGGVPTSISGNLSDVGNITADYYTLNNTAANPYLKLAHTYNSTNYNYYIQAYTGLLYLGAGSANSMAINSTGQVFLAGHLFLNGAQAASSTANTTQIIFRASNTQQVAISSNPSALIINPTSSTTTKQIVLGVGSVASTFGNSITCSGEVTASSDGRKKNIISNTKFNVKDIASARSVLFEWNDGRDDDMEKKIHGGSIAQDWLGKADSFLSQDKDGWYSINYGALALCSAITIAREVVKHEDRITLLEKENAKLKARVAELEERRA